MKTYKSTRQMLLASSLVILTACAGTAAAPKGTPAGASLSIDTAQFTALANAGDSAGIAKFVQGTCRRASDKSACYQSLLSMPAANGQVRVAMGGLRVLGSSDPDIKRSGHVYAHAIGISAGRGRRDIASAFSECTESFQSGCYHGVIQSWFAGLDSIGAADANALCAPFRNNESDRWIRFQCVHGMGHGLTMLYAHDLRKGLAGCDLLTDWWDRHSCYSGAFMENIVNVTMPHHPASALAHDHGAMEGMGGHDISAMDHGASASFKAVDPADPQYPCSAMGVRYQSACYEMQTSVMLYNNNGDIAGAAKECERAPAAMVAICFTSLGRDISSYSQQKHTEAVRMCRLANPKYQPWCFRGVVKNFIDLEARPSDGLSFCRDVPGASNKSVCYNAVGEQVAALQPLSEARKAACGSAEPEFVDACLYGARVEGVKVPGNLQEVWDSARKY